MKQLIRMSSGLLETSANFINMDLTWINFNSSRIKYYIHYKVWDEIIYPFPNFNSGAV